MNRFLKSLMIAGLAACWPVAALAADKPEVREDKVTNGDTVVKFNMVKIPGGKFQFSPTNAEGKPGDPQETAVKTFWIGQTEVPWELFDIFAFSLDLNEEEKKKDDSLLDKAARARPSKPYGAPDHGFGHDGYAAISMTHKSATRFCEWLSKKTGKKFRLATEAEWEFAASCGGKIEAKPMDVELVKKLAWCSDNSDQQTHPIGKKEANEWGLLDTLGNAGEWCNTLDGKPVLRGGGYRTPARLLHPGYRQVQTSAWNVTDPNDPKSTWWLSDGKFVGIRVVCEE